MNVSERLIELRKKCWLSQNGLAERAGVSQTHLRRVELGEADITIGHLQLLCDAMNITLKEFFDESRSEDNTQPQFQSFLQSKRSCSLNL